MGSNPIKPLLKTSVSHHAETSKKAWVIRYGHSLVVRATGTHTVVWWQITKPYGHSYTTMSAELPAEVKDRAEAIKEDNPDMDKSTAIAIARDQLNLAAEHDGISLDDDPCEDGYVMVGTKQQNGRTVPNCVPAEDADPANLESVETCPSGQVRINGECKDVTEVDAPASILSTPQHLTLKSLETEPIERVEAGGNTVRYKSLKLLSPGVWADSGSEMATYYPPDGIAALEPDYDESQHDGPPVNIMHDLDVDAWEAHEPSVAGHVDPNTLDTDDDGNLFGDIVFDTSKGAGQFADENLQSTLEKEGTVGFGGPSVEIPARGLQQSHDQQRDMPRVDGGLLTGVAMVMDPASKSVNFAREAARRPIAMSDSSTNAKVLTRQADSMRTKLLEGMADKLTLENADEVRETLDMFGFDGMDEMTDDEVMDMAEDLHEDLMSDLEGDGEDMEMGDYGDDEDDDEDDDMEMEDDGMDDMEAMQEQVQNLSSRLEDLEDAMSQAMTADDMNAELSDAKGQELAAADTVEELEDAKEELDRRLSELENEGKEAKTLTDQNDAIDYSDSDGGVNYDPATGSMSR